MSSASAPAATPESVRHSTHSRIDDDRQPQLRLCDGHGGHVEGEARGRFECPDAAFTEDHVLVALAQDVLGGVHPFVDRAAKAPLQHHGHPAATECPEKRGVLHVAAADLSQVDVATCPFDLLFLEDLAHGEEAEGIGGFTEQLPAVPAQSLEGGRRRAHLEGATSQEAAAAGGDHLCGLEHLLSRLDRTRSGHDDQLGSADCAVMDVDPSRVVVHLLSR